MTIREALDRTLLLMRDEIDERASNETMIEALTGTSVAVVADERNIATHSAQSAFITAATLAARSGHRVMLVAPNIDMCGAQPPLQKGPLVDCLMKAGEDLLPSIHFSPEVPTKPVDLSIAIGSSPVNFEARRSLRLNAGAWTGHVLPLGDSRRWAADAWPLGALASGAMGATEGFKIALQKLAPYARNPKRMAEVFAPSEIVSFALAPDTTPCCTDLGVFDSVSGGAITSAALYALLRIPGVRGRGRVIEPDGADISNLNRYPLLLRSANRISKARDLAAIASGLIEIIPVEYRFDADILPHLPGGLAPNVIVGVDDIPSRWAVQATRPSWLGIGATSHWSSMSSFHYPGTGCAHCLHKEDDASNDRIPTVAFVSFWAGLLTASYFLRHLAGVPASLREQQTFLTPLRPENPVRSPVPIRLNCPTCKVPTVPRREEQEQRVA